MARTRRVLVVDDDLDITELLGHLLKHNGYETRIATDGLQAVRFAEEFRPDFALLDISMPGLNGFDTATRIRSETWGRNIVFIGLSGYCGSEYEERARDAGFTKYLRKPMPIKTIMDVIETFSQESSSKGSEPPVEALDPIRIKNTLENAQSFICQLQESIAFNSYFRTEVQVVRQQTLDLLANSTNLMKSSREILQASMSGDKVVKGSKISLDGEATIVAAEVRRGDEVLRLRDERDSRFGTLGSTARSAVNFFTMSTFSP